MFNTVSEFYRSREWIKLLSILREERINEVGFLLCEQCGKPILMVYDCIGHHKIELTELNVNDYNISLNPDNIALVHHKCHNEIHERFGFYERKVYIVHGAPCSGKTSYVKRIAHREDLILDIDNVWEMISINPRYIKPGRLKQNVLMLRDAVLDQIKTRAGSWRNAYIIGGYPMLMERQRLADAIGAELIHIDTTKDECISRAKERPGEWKEYIEDYFERYTE